MRELGGRSDRSTGRSFQGGECGPPQRVPVVSLKGIERPGGRSLAPPEWKGLPTAPKPDVISAAMIGAEAGVAAKGEAGLSFLEQVGDFVIEAVDFADPTFVFSAGRLAFDAAFEKTAPDGKAKS